MISRGLSPDFATRPGSVSFEKQTMRPPVFVTRTKPGLRFNRGGQLAPSTAAEAKPAPSTAADATGQLAPSRAAEATPADEEDAACGGATSRKGDAEAAGAASSRARNVCATGPSNTRAAPATATGANSAGRSHPPAAIAAATFGPCLAILGSGANSREKTSKSVTFLNWSKRVH